MNRHNTEADGGVGIGREASYYIKKGGGAVECALCPRKCRIMPGCSGACLARKNRGGTLYSINYGKISSLALDPIEKKPLHRFHPGGMILSAGSFGCNFTCPFCQNHHISGNIPETAVMTPQNLVDKALSARARGNIGVAYTYNEPLVSYEFVLDAAGLARREGLVNVLVTNGYIGLGPLAELLPYIDAMNIDLKGDEAFYRELCGGGREAVLRAIETARAAGCHIEITTLLVSGRNDNIDAVEGIARQVASLSDEIPLHLSRFFPRYKMADLLPTDIDFIRDAVKTARMYLKYVYAGNI